MRRRKVHRGKQHCRIGDTPGNNVAAVYMPRADSTDSIGFQWFGFRARLFVGFLLGNQEYQTIFERSRPADPGTDFGGRLTYVAERISTGYCSIHLSAIFPLSAQFTCSSHRPPDY